MELVPQGSQHSVRGIQERMSPNHPQGGYSGQPRLPEKRLQARHLTQSHRRYLSRMSSVIARNSGDIGESIYQQKGWKTRQQQKKTKNEKSSRYSVEMVQVSIDQKPVSR